MTKPNDDNATRKYLAAFADGELDVEQNLRVLEQMAMDPQATRRVMHQQQLRQAVKRALESPDAPESLRQQIEAMAAEAQKPPRRAVLASVVRRATPWAMAAAVMLAVAISWLGGPGSASASPISHEQLEKLSRRHVACSRHVERLSQAVDFPDDVSALPEAMAKYLGAPTCRPDLTSLGYAYTGAGPCQIPGNRSVHLIYEARTQTDRADAISLWLAPYTGEPTIAPHRVYTATGPEAAHPVYLWRRGGVIYYMVSDSTAAANAASKLLSEAP